MGRGEMGRRDSREGREPERNGGKNLRKKEYKPPKVVLWIMKQDSEVKFSMKISVLSCHFSL